MVVRLRRSFFHLTSSFSECAGGGGGLRFSRWRFLWRWFSLLSTHLPRRAGVRLSGLLKHLTNRTIWEGDEVNGFDPVHSPFFFVGFELINFLFLYFLTGMSLTDFKISQLAVSIVTFGRSGFKLPEDRYEY